jgi:hypothetical protein
MRQARRWLGAVAWVGALSACSFHEKAAAVGESPDADTAPAPIADVPAVPALAEAGSPSQPRGSAHPHAASGCAGTLVPVLAAPGASPECVLECESDPSCPEGLICGARAPLAENGKPGKPINFCVAGRRANSGKADAGAFVPAAPDAGLAPPAKRLDVRKSAASGCPTGYAACAAACRLVCKTNAECGLATAHCSGGLCQGPGALPCK